MREALQENLAMLKRKRERQARVLEDTDSQIAAVQAALKTAK